MLLRTIFIQEQVLVSTVYNTVAYISFRELIKSISYLVPGQFKFVTILSNVWIYVGISVRIRIQNQIKQLCAFALETGNVIKAVYLSTVINRTCVVRVIVLECKVIRNYSLIPLKILLFFVFCTLLSFKLSEFNNLSFCHDSG